MYTRSSSVRLVPALIMVTALVMCAVAPAAASTGYPPVIVIGPGGPPAPPPPGSGSVIVIGPGKYQGNGSGIGVGNWANLASTITYKFDYVGGGAAAEISVGADPGDGVIFNVYTQQQWQFLVNGDQNVTPIGRGTFNSYAAGNLFWKAQSAEPLTFYVQVIPKVQPVKYWISLAGNGGKTTLTVVRGSGTLVGPLIVSPAVPPYGPPGPCRKGKVRVACR